MGAILLLTLVSTIAAMQALELTALFRDEKMY